VSRVAIHLAAASVDRDIIRSLFHDVNRVGGRVVNITLGTDSAGGLQTAIEGVGSDYEQLLLVVGRKVYEATAHGPHPLVQPSEAGGLH
jgi:hypothetical protein